MTQDKALCRRCGQSFEIATMTKYDKDYAPWYMCAICGDDMDYTPYDKRSDLGY